MNKVIKSAAVYSQHSLANSELVKNSGCLYNPDHTLHDEAFPGVFFCICFDTAEAYQKITRKRRKDMEKNLCCFTIKLCLRLIYYNRQ